MSHESTETVKAQGVEVSVGRYDTQDGIKLGVDGEHFWRTHLTPQGEILTGSGGSLPTPLSAAFGAVPTNWTCWALFVAPNTGSWSTIQASGGGLANGFRYGASTVNNEATWDVPLKAGTYTFGMAHTTDNNRGIYDVKLDGTTIATIDGYSAATADVFTVTTSVTVATSGLHVLRFLMSTKNASSSAYFGAIGMFGFTRTGA